MNPFIRRQSLLILVVIIAITVATSGSFFFRGFLTPVPWPAPFYINPIYLLMLILFGGLGIFTVLRADDRGWPLFAGAVGLWIFIIAFEDSVLQWFVFQLGARTVGGRINPFLMTGSIVAMGAAILLHVGQLGRRLRNGLAERGIDPRELQQVERRTHEIGSGLVIRMGALAAAGSVALWLGEFALGRSTVGIGALGILGGLLIMSLIAVMAYRILKTGATSAPVDPAGKPVERPRSGRRRPPSGLS